MAAQACSGGVPRSVGGARLGCWLGLRRCWFGWRRKVSLSGSQAASRGEGEGY